MLSLQRERDFLFFTFFEKTRKNNDSGIDFGFIFRSLAPARARSDLLTIFDRFFAHFVSDLAVARRSLGRSFLRLHAQAPFRKNLQKHWAQQQNQGSALLAHPTFTTALALKKALKACLRITIFG